MRLISILRMAGRLTGARFGPLLYKRARCLILCASQLQFRRMVPNLYARVWTLQSIKLARRCSRISLWIIVAGQHQKLAPNTFFKHINPQHRSGLISFQASFTVGYVLEFGDGYIRFYYRGSPIIETGVAITAATKANPCVLTIPGHTYSVGEWIYVQDVGGMTQLNEKYFIVSAVAGNNVTIAGLNGTNINSTGYSTYTSGGTASRVYTLASPYTSSDDLRLIKFAQSVNQMVLCHPNHSPYVLTLIAATNWTLVPIVIGATISAPGTPTVSGSFVYFPGATPTNYSYGVTSIGTNGQESSMSPAGALYSYDMRTVTGTVKVTWTAVQGAVAYNVYKTQVSYFGVLPVGVQYGFVGTCKDVNFIDSNISADFTQTPPISKNPFVGSGIDHVTVTSPELTLPYQRCPSVDRQQSLRLLSRFCRFRVCRQSRLAALALPLAIPLTSVAALLC